MKCSFCKKRNGYILRCFKLVMSTEDAPAHEESEFIFEDKPVLLTMISGGLVMSLLLFFILKWSLGTIGVRQLEIIPWIASIYLLISTIRKGRVSDVVIKINTKTGWVYARNTMQFWEGYANELTRFEVLQRQEQNPRGDRYTRYKLFLELSDESTYEVPLLVVNVKDAIELVEKTKSAIPVKAIDPDLLLNS